MVTGREWISTIAFGIFLFFGLWEYETDEGLYYFIAIPEFNLSQFSLCNRSIVNLGQGGLFAIDKSVRTQKIDRRLIIRWDRYAAEHDDTPKEITCGIFHCAVSLFPQRIPPNTTGAYIFHLLSIDFSDLPLPRHPNHVLWGAILPESPKDALFHHEHVLKLFNYSSTFSRYSDVPIYTHLPTLDNITNTKYFVKTYKKNLLLEELAPILFLQTNCGALSQREHYVEELMKFQKVDSYGPCLNNKLIPDKLGAMSDYLSELLSEKVLEFIARYKFVIAIENCVCEGYLTEKYWRAISVGVVPIYFGSPTIREWFPNPKSAILIEDFSTPKLLSAHIDKLMSDDELYEDYLQHKTKGDISNVNLINKLKLNVHKNYDPDREFVCFLCGKLHSIEDDEHRAINKSHYDCPTPISVLTQEVNKSSSHVNAKYATAEKAKRLFEAISKDSGY